MQEFIFTVGTEEILFSVLGIFGALIFIVWQIGEWFGNVLASNTALEQRLIDTEAQTKEVYASVSSVSLLLKGEALLDESGLRSFIDANLDRFLQTLKQRGGLTTAYEIQQTAFDFINSYSFPETLNRMMEQTAFAKGLSVGVVRRVGGIYLRDRLLQTFGLDLSGADRPTLNL